MTVATKAPSAYQVPAVDKALDVMEHLADRPDGASMSEIGATLGRSLGELYRIVVVLERRGFVTKDPSTDRYHLSLRVFELAHRHPPVARLVRRAQPVLDDLAAETLQSCHLAVAEGARLLILAAAESPLPMHYSVKVGAAFPVMETSSGCVIVAHARAERREAVIAALPNAERAEAAARCAAVAAAGHEIIESRVVRGVTNLSVPVRNHAGAVIAALTVPYLEQAGARASREDVLSLLQAAADRLSRSLGHIDTKDDHE
jgi:DNA-binding IclR family transcriptional regulator